MSIFNSFSRQKRNDLYKNPGTGVDFRIYYSPQILTFTKISAKAVHDGMDCKQYQQYSLNDANDENSKKTKEWIEVIS